MTRKSFYFGALALAPIAVIIVGVTVMLSLSGRWPGPTAPSNDMLAKTTAPAPQGVPDEGIRVHGHWIIDIRNPDGTLVTHREFENALTSEGAEVLGQFIKRALKPGEWRITLANNAGTSPCLAEDTGARNCDIYEPSTVEVDANRSFSFKTLTLPAFAPGAKLAGTATAARDGSIIQVWTSLTRCGLNNSGACPADEFIQFTRTTLATPINVMAGQIIQVTVVIRFS